jgi:chromosome segregation protein
VRLNSIKLSGFKSFAEPTNFMLPGQRVGVVGPNGCGKSNIMDAVRWVLGESRASELRGESMQDVIFNGTTTRKPSSRSSVELVFDNADHRAGGQWSQYAEIAVKRVLTRDGSSSYYINNQPVRRRDVQDVFLGTGLGPRAYAIIGQGTISRIIESRPEDLRLFLEEAAGVSKYKERRRETENRLSDTRENLTRVEDILRELNAQLEKLEKQAEVAQRYHELQRSSAHTQQLFWFLKRQEAAQSVDHIRVQTEQARTDLESRTAQLRETEAALENIRQSHFASGEQVNLAQGKLYEASAEVGRLEAEIRYVVESRQRTEQRLQQLLAQDQQWQEQFDRAQTELLTLEDQQGSGEQLQEQLAAQLESLTEGLPQAEQAWRQARDKADGQRQAVNEVQQRIQVLSGEQRLIDDQTRQLQVRLERLQADQRQLQAVDPAQLDEFQQRLTLAQAQADQAREHLAELETRVPGLDEARRQAQANSTQESSKLTDLSARREALQALQDKLKTDGRLQPWLDKHGLSGLNALWTQLHIEPGWENALEAALRERMQSLGVGQLDGLAALAADAPPVKLSFHSQQPGQAPVPQHAQLKTLVSGVRVQDAALQSLLNLWLAGCYTAPDVATAMRHRASLQPGEVIFTPQGHSISAQSLSFHAADSEQSGLLARAQEIENLDKLMRAQTLMAEESRAALVRAESAHSQAQQQLGVARDQANRAQTASHQAQVEWMQLSQRAEQTQSRSVQLDEDVQDVTAQLETLEGRRQELQAQFEALDMQLADGQERHAQLDDHVIQAEAQLQALRNQSRDAERALQTAQFELRSISSRRDELVRNQQTATEQRSSVAAEQSRLQGELTQLNDAAAQAGLQDALAVKMAREQALSDARSQYDDLTQRLRHTDDQRLQIERSLEPLRQRITDWQLKAQAAQIAHDQYDQYLVDAQANLELLAEDARTSTRRLGDLQAEMDQLHRDISALGAVNLAALEELSAARERKGFLDAQSADLNEAIQTLEDAIRKIDGETRELLQHTFNTVNEHFGRMFPELFGGGNAKLVMTGEEILDAGVQVMAQPPGKKNQTIHLLSGGEKALTAIALVFAIFQLNPAPFCLLDEVDAPLDDANTERYAKLVSRMSSDTQFLFISHNKIAMEMAEQLIGVTMQEQGVSRIVAVDMEAAVGMAETE